MRRNVRIDPFDRYPHAYSPVLKDINNIDGVIRSPDVSIGGVVDGRFFGTIQLELEQDFEDNPSRCMEVGRQLSKCLDRYGLDASSVHCHVASKHVDAGA